MPLEGRQACFWEVRAREQGCWAWLGTLPPWAKDVGDQTRGHPVPLLQFVTLAGKAAVIFRPSDSCWIGVSSICAVVFPGLPEPCLLMRWERPGACVGHVLLPAGCCCPRLELPASSQPHFPPGALPVLPHMSSLTCDTQGLLQSCGPSPAVPPHRQSFPTRARHLQSRGVLLHVVPVLSLQSEVSAPLQVPPLAFPVMCGLALPCSPHPTGPQPILAPRPPHGPGRTPCLSWLPWSPTEPPPFREVALKSPGFRDLGTAPMLSCALPSSLNLAVQTLRCWEGMQEPPHGPVGGPQLRVDAGSLDRHHLPQGLNGRPLPSTFQV